MMMIEILNIKAREARTTRYLALTYVIYAVFGTVFFTVYPCGSLNPDLLPSILDDLIGTFPLLDYISSCPVRRKLSMLYMLVGLYIFSLAGSLVYIIDRRFILNLWSQSIRKAIPIASKRKIRVVFVFFYMIFSFFFNLDVLFLAPAGDPPYSVTRYTTRIFGDAPGSFLIDFLCIMVGGPMAIVLVMASFDLIFISGYLIGDDRNGN